jgi:hypothetical protein
VVSLGDGAVTSALRHSVVLISFALSSRRLASLNGTTMHRLEAAGCLLGSVNPAAGRLPLFVRYCAAVAAVLSGCAKSLFGGPTDV